MTARISAAEAKRLGFDVPAKTRKTRKVAPTAGRYRSTCRTCGETFTTYAGEDRHVHDTHHARYNTLEGQP